MQGTVDLASAESAHDELETVMASLARTPRLEQLLRYLARRYFEGETDQLTEYNIATEVFGRKKTEFIASEDAIARVETHRLRRKLAAYYETQGRDHAVHISIPLGAYVPLFVERAAARSDAAVRSETAAKEPAPATQERPSEPAVWLEDAGAEDVREVEARAGVEGGGGRSSSRRWLVAAAVLLIVSGVVAGVVALIAHTGAGARRSAAGQRVVADGGAVEGSKAVVAGKGRTAGVMPAGVPLRMIAGYTGAPQRDNDGDVWAADHFYEGGWARHQSKAFIARTGNAFLFRYGRAGDMAYTIPLPPGVYELHLYFMQGSDTEQSEDAENKEIFNVSINDVVMLKSFDIVSDAMGREVADERVFRDISPSADGMLHLHLSTVLGTPSLSAIEIVPGSPHAQLPIRLVMQPTSYTDRKGQLWRPDDYYLGGRSLSHNLPETGTESDVLPFERYGHFAYALPVDTRDRYTVTLRFVELYFGPQGTELPEDRRLFRVLCNGATLLDDFDISKEAGSFRVLEKTFHHLKPSAQGKLNLDFEPISNYATVSSIEVVDEAHPDSLF